MERLQDSDFSKIGLCTVFPKQNRPSAQNDVTDNKL